MECTSSMAVDTASSDIGIDYHLVLVGCALIAQRSYVPFPGRRYARTGEGDASLRKPERDTWASPSRWLGRYRQSSRCLGEVPAMSPISATLDSACSASSLAASASASSLSCSRLAASAARRAVSAAWRCRSCSSSAMRVSSSAAAFSASRLALFLFSLDSRGLSDVDPVLESCFFGFGESVNPIAAAARRERKDQAEYQHQTNHTYLLVLDRTASRKDYRARRFCQDLNEDDVKLEGKSVMK